VFCGFGLSVPISGFFPPMARRSTRRAELFPTENQKLLAALGECRRAVLQARTCLKPNSDVYQLGSALLASIDALAMRLTAIRNISGPRCTPPASTHRRQKGVDTWASQIARERPTAFSVRRPSGRTAQSAP
jgi:hypothetical protein